MKLAIKFPRTLAEHERKRSEKLSGVGLYRCLVNGKYKLLHYQLSLFETVRHEYSSVVEIKLIVTQRYKPVIEAGHTIF